MAIRQQDATTPISEIAERVGLSQTPCWKRIKRYEREGLIERRMTILNRERLGWT
ncbi:winged helix-turn-helix transcriptional regulator [Sphingobium sp. JS3065]|uniref:Lrp/AsnC family transcriptional regulator n=1 Tax=Sphingobium sp. JS3065 TaxID=2970925 RepID=UPI0022651A44|nr:winged helix-turn-helix transcriptional regulator [Sphingobium sp. JS3065]UZW55484.1 winged helix-turn-helix transcriptional regulator [Sphingobium sp. JS3065]